MSAVCVTLSPFPVCHEAAVQAPAVHAVELHEVVQPGREGANIFAVGAASESAYAGSVTQVSARRSFVVRVSGP